MNVNMLILLVAALVPLLTGFIWYHPKVFGNSWMKLAGITEEKMQGANMAKIFIATFILSFFLAFGLQFAVIHQFHVGSLFQGQPFDDTNTEAGALFKTIMDKVGGNFRTFKHGALHGTLSGFFMSMPILGINALFERKGFKYIALNTGYWMLTMALMGGIICAFS
jgi:hypothetical protein